MVRSEESQKNVKLYHPNSEFWSVYIVFKRQANVPWDTKFVSMTPVLTNGMQKRKKKKAREHMLVLRK